MAHWGATPSLKIVRTDGWGVGSYTLLSWAIAAVMRCGFRAARASSVTQVGIVSEDSYAGPKKTEPRGALNARGPELSKYDLRETSGDGDHKSHQTEWRGVGGWGPFGRSNSTIPAPSLPLYVCICVWPYCCQY
jgi:hypothetical protein